jgi:hypothetical protein
MGGTVPDTRRTATGRPEAVACTSGAGTIDGMEQLRRQWTSPVTLS